MRISTARNHTHKFKTRVSDIYSLARYCALSHAEILDCLGDVYASPTFRKLPRWAKVEIREHSRMQMERLYQLNIGLADLTRMLERARAGEPAPLVPVLRWAHFVDGVETDTHSLIAVQRAEGADSPRCTSRTIWNHRPERAF